MFIGYKDNYVDLSLIYLLKGKAIGVGVMVLFTKDENLFFYLLNSKERTEHLILLIQVLNN